MIAKLEEMMATPPPGQDSTRPMSMAGTFVGPDQEPDEYQLVTLVGSGGEAQVWRALTRPDPASAVTVTVAVKIFTAELDDAQAADWLRRTQSARHIHNPALARVHAAFIGAPMHPRLTPAHPAAGRCRYLVMEFVDGPSLLEWVEDHPEASLRGRLRLLLTLAAGLDALHAGSSTVPPVAHGDVKPDNARLTPDGGVKLVDFGLLRIQGTTRSGPAMATLPYTAPEFFAAGEHAVPTPEADRFAFAATVFHVLTGVVPPLRPDRRGPDLAVLRPILERSPLTSGRPEVLATVMSGLLADPLGRPAQLVPWLAAARRTETAGISQAMGQPGSAGSAGSAGQATLPMPGLASTSRDFAEPAPQRAQSQRAQSDAMMMDGSVLDRQPMDGPGYLGRRRSLRPIVRFVVLLLLLAVPVLIWLHPWPDQTSTGNQAGDTPTSHPSAVHTSHALHTSQTGASQSSGSSSTASHSGKGKGPAGNGNSGNGNSTAGSSGTTQTPRLTSRTLASGEDLDLDSGVIGTDVKDYEVDWDGNDLFTLWTRVALIPAITTRHACETQLKQRQDNGLTAPDQVSDGKALCLITTKGRIAAFRLASMDVSSHVTLEYIVW